MKRFQIFFAFSLLIIIALYMADNSYSLPQKKPKLYEKEWQKVDSLQKAGLFKQAMQESEKILQLAKSELNAPQRIKAVVKINNFRGRFEEDAQLKNIKFVENELNTAEEPAKSVLASLLADFYWNYFQQQRWQILERGIVQSSTSDTNISLWNAQDFSLKVKQLYLQSVRSSNFIKNIPARDFDAILDTAHGSETFRPFLYDILVFKAINFFENEESGLALPQQEWRIDDPKLLSNAGDFARLKIAENVKDEDASFELLAALLYQEVLKFHLADKEPFALIDADLQRLKFIHQKAVFSNKDELYYAQLKSLSEKYANHKILAEIDFERAQFIYHQHLPKEFDGKAKGVIALEIAENIIKKYPETRGAEYCRALKNQILQKSLSTQIQQTQTVGKPWLVNVDYRNWSKLYYRIYKVSQNKKREIEQQYNQKTLLELFGSTHALVTKELNLPLPKDYEKHSAEFAVENINSSGLYLLAISAQSDFGNDSNLIRYHFVSVSNLRFIQQNVSGQKEYKFYVLNAENAEPVSGAKVRFYSSEYDYKTQKSTEKLVYTLTSGKDGAVSYTPTGRISIDRMEVEKGKDILYSNISIYSNFNEWSYQSTLEERKKVQKVSYIFTDRSIYRPGQTVYFKGIVAERKNNGKDNEVLRNQKVNLILRNVNREEVAKQSLTTNDFGSYTGSFSLPMGLLTGNFIISDYISQQNFSVEEYKRPRFEVTFDPVYSSIRLNDKVLVNGKAKSYAGVALGNVQVKYRVVRQARFPYWFRFWMPQPESAEKEIAHGTVFTDGEGKFSINFTAEADPEIDAATKPEFNFIIYADVIDLSGETQSAQTTVNVGTVALRTDISVPDFMISSKDYSLRTNTTNLNSQIIISSGKIIIEKLKSPKRVVHERLWEAPDQFSMTEKEFIKQFPHQPYREEHKVYNLPAERKLIEENLSSNAAYELKQNQLQNWEKGYYKVSWQIKDTFGTSVDVVKYFKLIDTKGKALPEMSYFVPVNAADLQPGDKAQFIVGSGLSSVFYVRAESNGKIFFEQEIDVNNGQKTIEIPVKEEHFGGFYVHVFSVIQNRLYTHQQFVSVPLKRDLQITTSTFRDKLKPGEPEKWQLNIKGPNAEVVAAEMMATLYDASLNAFRPHNWELSLNPYIYSRLNVSGLGMFEAVNGNGRHFEFNPSHDYHQYGYDHFIWSDEYDYISERGVIYNSRNKRQRMVFEDMADLNSFRGNVYMKSEEVVNAQIDPDDYSIQLERSENSNKKEQQKPEPQIRKNLNETAFFFPQLKTNESGDIVMEFTMPEALTRWKFMALAHTKDLKIGQLTKEIVTQKELMIQPNAPRFLREGDTIEFTATISNLSDKEIVVKQPSIQFIDIITNKTIEYRREDGIIEYNYEIARLKPGKTSVKSQTLVVPNGVTAIQYTAIAKSDNFSDAEQGILPVLPSRTLVTESVAMWVRGNQTKNFKLDKLLNASNSKTLKPYRLKLEMTSNPAWYAVQSLPYLADFPYECAEQTFNRFYAFALSQHIASTNPRIENMAKLWKTQSGLQSTKSPLQRNEELKQVLLQETPWVAEAKDETERTRRLADLFDLEQQKQNQLNALMQLEKLQLNSGAWPWFSGMYEDRFITQYIVGGMGHLQKLGVKTSHNQRIDNMKLRAISYMDRKMQEDYDYLIRHKINLENDNSGSIIKSYLYARSFFLKENPISKEHQKAFDYWKSQAVKYWLKGSLIEQAMLATTLQRLGETAAAKKILASLKDRSLQSEEMGMYWAENKSGWYWFNHITETQAHLIEAFDEVANDAKAVEEMKIWLLKQKQTQNWPSTKATADACYALLIRGQNLLVSTEMVQVYLGNQLFDPQKTDAAVKPEPGTGYFANTWQGAEIQPKMGDVKVVKKDEGIAWGALHFQYFEDMDKVTSNLGKELSVKKELYIQENTSQGPRLIPYKNQQLKVGDLIKVRLIIKTDRVMEYVHLKDLRASAFEPTDVLSGYQYSGGLGYYKSIKDASMNFFIDRLPRGTYVLEYNLRASQSGNFSNGFATLQCMYAPEFISHSEGVRVEVW